MNSLIERVNVWADHAFRFAWPTLWQSSLLIAVLFGLDLLLRRQLRPAVRYALWLVVLVKLLLPPSLAFPTSISWWVRPAKAAPAEPRPTTVVVTYGANGRPALPATVTPVLVAPPPPHLSPAGWTFLGTAAVSLGLLVWMLARWYQVARDARGAAAAPDWVKELLPELPRSARLRLTDRPQSPAVCGLFRPVILLPRSLAEQLPPAQLRAVLLHELFHLCRGDVWVNCAQALLQIVYWWHPLLWLANARIRRVREEAVDDAVMLALNEDAETYAPTLLEVAKLALHRPLASLGLVGILESRSSLRHRLERLMDFHPPRKAGLGLVSVIGVLGFAALAVPMGEAPTPTTGPGLAAPGAITNGSVSGSSSSAGLPTEHLPLYVRTFKVDPNTLLDGLGVAKGPVGTNRLGAIVPALRDHLARAGVDLDPTTNPGKAIFYSDRQGILMVRATLQDLDIIEREIAKLNTAPPQINIKARFVEVPHQDTKDLDFDWYLGNVLTNNGSTGGQLGAAASSAGTNGQLLTSSRRLAGSPPFTIGILTEPQYLVVLKALEQREGTELLAQPEVTTSSGRQVQCKTTDIRSVVKGINERALTPPGITSTNDDESSVYGIEPMEFGGTLDGIPTVLPDGYAINLPVVVTLAEFLGYDDTPTNRVAVYVNGQQKWVSPPRPSMQTRQMTATVNVWDGQTVVLGDLVSERISTIKDQVPILGDLPLVGRLFRSESKTAQKRDLLVFITPTIIDPAGNRVHAAEERPFPSDTIPPQPPR